MMFTVALIGPDGSGKSTISARLLSECPIPIQRVYMGINRNESNFSLPTTRLIHWIYRRTGRRYHQGGPRTTTAARQPAPKNPVVRVFRHIKSGLVLTNLIAEEWYRQLVSWYFMRRGRVVIFDRHFYVDYYHYDIEAEDRAWSDRIHGYLLEHFYPRPDIVIYLDAPAALLFARKGEGNLALLEKRRQDYLDMRDKVTHFEIVDASRPVDQVYSDVLSIILTRAGYPVEDVQRAAP